MKAIILKIHFYLAILSGLVIFIVALTGTILVFEEELKLIFSRSQYIVDDMRPSSRCTIDSLLRTEEIVHCGKPLSFIHSSTLADRTIIVGCGKNREEMLCFALNPYTAKVQTRFQPYSSFFSVVLRLHRFLCLGKVGKTITGISCLIFIVIIITGIMLWYPRRRTIIKQRFQIKWRASKKSLNWNLHAVFGFYVSPFLLIIALTGLVWSYQWMNTMLYVIFDGKKPEKKIERSQIISHKAYRSVILWDTIMSQTDKILPYQGDFHMTVNEEKASIQVRKENHETLIKHQRSILDFGFDGALRHIKKYETRSLGEKARSFVFPIHTGGILGWPTKILAFCVAFITSSLPITGFLIWYFRTYKKKKI